MTTNTTVRFDFEIKVNDLERFKELVAKCVTISNEEEGTLLYDWYLDEAAGEARLVEAYASVEALLVHVRGPVFTEVGPELLQTCTFVTANAYGELPARMTEGPGLCPTKYWGKSMAALEPR